ncbi:MAG TPA: cyclic nucleotide-binding domain-containing protein [Gammaproteobacteria bacterium]
MDLVELFRESKSVESRAAGETIFEQGEAGAVMYVILDGEVDIQVSGQTVERAGAGSLFGELALIDTRTRSATVTARSDCRLVSMDRTSFLEMVQRFPAFSLHVMRVLGERLRRMDANMAKYMGQAGGD